MLTKRSLTPLPKLSLTHGQMLWALCEGQAPTKPVIDQFRYLRQLGIPFSEAELGSGRGNRLTYDFDHFIECGAALFGLRQGLRPREVASILLEHRPRFRELFRKAFQEQEPEAIDQPWVKSRGQQRVFKATPGILLAINDRFGQEPLKLDIVLQEEPALPAHAMPLDMMARYTDGQIRILLDLSEKVLVWVAWALEAPEIRPGRR